MELASHRTKLAGRGQLVRLYPVGDIHLGAPACDVAHLRRTVATIANDPNGFWIGMGDYADCILPGDKRWHLRTIDWNTVARDSRGQWDASDLAEWSVEIVEKELKPILTPEKCLGLLEGNHERSFADHYFTDLTRRLAKRYDIPFLGQTALIRWTFSRSSGGREGASSSFDIFAEHGAQGGGTDGNSVNNFNKRLEGWEFDLALKGHVHKRAVWRKTRYSHGGKRLKVRRQVMVLTGTYLKGYPEGQLAYSEQKAYTPNEIGGTVVLLKPFEEMIDAVYAEAMEMVAA